MSWETPKRYTIERPGKAPLSFEGRLFCETDLAGTYSVRLYITEEYSVYLVCIARDAFLTVAVSKHETLEDAANELAALPQELVPNTVYEAFLEALDEASRHQE